MAISPVEMISLAPKSQEASFQKHTEVQKPTVEQQVLTAKMHTEIRHNSTQAVPTKKSDNPEYRYDAKEKGNNSYEGQGKKQKKKNSDHKEEETKASVPGRIDIRI